jgi:hypothetical protein
MIYFEHADSYIAQLKDIKVDGLVFYKSAIDARGLDIESFVHKHYPDGINYLVVDTDKGTDSDRQTWSFAKYPEKMQPGSYLVKEDWRENFDDKILWLSDLCKDNAVIVLGVTSARLITGLDVNVSVNPYLIAGKGEIILPNGQRVKCSEWHPTANGGKAWIEKVGYDWNKLYNSDTTELTKFNIKSFLMMREMKEEIKQQGFSTPPPKENKGSVKEKTPDNQAIAVVQKGSHCDDCGWKNCPYRKEGSVCVKDKLMKESAKSFGSRDINIIRKNMSHILQEEAERYEMGRQLERTIMRPVKEVTTISANLMNWLEKLESISGTKDKNNPLIDARSLHIGDKELNELKEKYGEDAIKEALGGLVKNFVPKSTDKPSK